MLSLSLTQWARYEPSIPGNAALPVAERFHLEVCAGMPSVQFDALVAALDGAETTDAAIAAMLPVVRLGSVPLKLNGFEVTDVTAYLAAILSQRGKPLWGEMTERLLHFNSYGGTRELFCGRPSGGIGTTPGASTAPGASQTAAP